MSEGPGAQEGRFRSLRAERCDFRVTSIDIDRAQTCSTRDALDTDAKRRDRRDEMRIRPWALSVGEEGKSGGTGGPISKSASGAIRFSRDINRDRSCTDVFDARRARYRRETTRSSRRDADPTGTPWTPSAPVRGITGRVLEGRFLCRARFRAAS